MQTFSSDHYKHWESRDSNKRLNCETTYNSEFNVSRIRIIQFKNLYPKAYTVNLFYYVILILWNNFYPLCSG